MADDNAGPPGKAQLAVEATIGLLDPAGTGRQQEARGIEAVTPIELDQPPARDQHEQRASLRFSLLSHAAVRGSGRVGRSAAGRALEPEAIELAVAAAVRHHDTRYDELLMSGLERGQARAEVRADVARVLDSWRRR